MAPAVKRFEELTHADLLGLTTEQVDYYVDRACAEEGVPLLPESSPVPPPGDHPVPHRTFYCVRSVSGLLFDDPAVAEQVADVLSQVRRYRLESIPGRDWRNHEQYAKPVGDRETTATVKHLDEHLYETHRLRVEQYEASRADYAEARTAYDAAVQKRLEVFRRVAGFVTAAQALERRREALRAMFRRYVELAAGDIETAQRFLRQAVPDAEEACPELFGPGEEPRLVEAYGRGIRVRGVSVEEVTA